MHDYIDGHAANLRYGAHESFQFVKQRSFEAHDQFEKEGLAPAAKDVLFNTATFLTNKAKIAHKHTYDYVTDPKVHETVKGHAKTLGDIAHGHIMYGAEKAKEGASHVYTKVTDPEFHAEVSTKTKNFGISAYETMKNTYNGVVEGSKDFYTRLQEKGFGEATRESLQRTASWMKESFGAMNTT